MSPEFEMVGAGRKTDPQANYDFLHSNDPNIQSVLDTAMVNSLSIGEAWLAGSSPMSDGDDPSYLDVGMNLIGDRIKSNFGDLEALVAIGSRSVGEVVSGLTMIMTGGDVGAGRAVGEAFAYMPRTEYGQQRLQKVGEVMEPIAQGLEWTRTTLGDFGYEVGGAWLGAGLSAVPDALLAFAAPEARGAFGAVSSSAYNGLKATGRVFAPTAGRMAESFLDSQGLILRIVPEGPRSVPKPGDYDFMGPLLGPNRGIDYGALDALGRPTGVRATIAEDMIGTGTPANPSITPPGWSGNVSLFNEARGHLLGNQLGGSGNVAENIVTLQQNPANSPFMRGFENQVRSAVESGQIVQYSSTPIYNGSNLVPRGITLSGSGSGGFDLNVTILNPPGF
jgi:hypothetical protein